MKPLTNKEIDYLFHTDDLKLRLLVDRYIIYFKVTDNRIKMWYYIEDVKIIISMARPIDMFNKYKIGAVYNLEALLDEC